MNLISNLGFDEIKSFEGLRLRAYDDLQPNVTITDESQVKGTLTIGYGHIHNVQVGDEITEAEAIEFLREDLIFAEMGVKSTVKVPLTQNMYDALVSLVFNIGVGNFADKQYGNNPYLGSTLLYKLNKGDYKGASERFGDFVRSGGQVLQGLVDRRESERKLFVKDMAVLQYRDFTNGGSIVDGIVNDTVVLDDKKKSSPLTWLIVFLIVKAIS